MTTQSLNISAIAGILLSVCPFVFSQDVVSVSSYGAVGDGITDDTDALAAAALAAAGKTLVIPTGVFLTNGLTLAPGTTLQSEGNGVLKCKTNSAAVNIDNDCKVINVHFDGSLSGGMTASIGINVPNKNRFQIQGCTFQNCGMQAISIVISKHGTITDNYIENCGYGIQWWGGDASSLGNTIATSHLTIKGNIVKSCIGGIWGSLGGRITIIGNNVEDMQDVGIDIEGGSFVTVSGNNVKNCINGGITFFYGPQNVSINGNTVEQEAGYASCIYAHTEETSSYVVISGNTLYSAGSPAIQTDFNSLGDSVISSNYMQSNTIAIRLLQCNRIDTVGNRMLVTGTNPIGVSYEGVSNSLIDGNYIQAASDASTPSVGGGIFLYWRSASFPCQGNTVTNNVVKGFVTSINDCCWGDLASRNLIDRNRVDTIYRKAGVWWQGKISNNVSVVNPNSAITAITY
jgi:hypothetical protein